MEKMFLTVLNMSLTTSFVIAVILFVRLLLKKAPKFISYTLWAVVGFRFIIPVTLEGTFSLLPFKSEPIPQDIAMRVVPRIDSGVTVVDDVVSASLPATTLYESANTLQIWIFIASHVWLFGMALMLVYSFLSIVILKRRLNEASWMEGNLYETDRIKTPFVIGLFKSKIYIPVGLSNEERRYIVLHERTHIRRYDHVIKMLAYFVLCLHWFNPLAWAAFVLMSADMEMSCDERVMKELGEDIKKAYSMTLVRVAAGRRILNGSPLAFGEGGMKERVKNVLNFKKSSRVIVITAVALTVVLSIGFAVNQITPTAKDEDFSKEDTDNLDTLYAMRTAYVGDASAVGGIINSLPELDEAYKQKFFSIGDNNALTVYYEPNHAQMDDISSVTITPKNAVLLFLLIDNLEEVNYAFRETASGGELDKDAYGSHIIFSKEDIAEYLDTIGLEWNNFQKDWKGSVEKMFATNDKDMIDYLITRTSEEEDSDVSQRVEYALETIMSSPRFSSNPHDFINEHRETYENLLKYSEGVLEYLLSQFEEGNSEGLRGHIMMYLCKDILGVRDKVSDESLSPQEWYNQLSILNEITLPDYMPSEPAGEYGELIYSSVTQHYSHPGNGFTVVAPTVYGTRKERDRLKIFVTVFYERYRLYDKSLESTGGGVIPGALTFEIDKDGYGDSWALVEYLEVGTNDFPDGALFDDSIRKLCVMPISGKKLKGIAKEMIADYSNEERLELQKNNLIEHLKAYGHKGVSMLMPDGSYEKLQ